MDIKVCSKCKEEKSLDEFYKDIRNRDGLYIYCRKCHNCNCLKYYFNNRKTIQQKSKAYRKSRKYKETRKLYLERTKKRRSLQYKQYQTKYKNDIQKQRKSYRIINKNAIQYRNNIYCKRRWQSDIHYRIKKTMSCIIRSRLKSRLLSKNGKSTFTFLPYTVDELKQHLESQFEPWMDWKNYGNRPGKWTIDHIIPDSSFNYTSVEDEEFQKCWALKNLRPLEYIDNIKKSNKL